MQDDEFEEREPQLESQEAEKPTRDADGRWLPGHCPNPAGRPRKKYGLFDASDLRYFGRRPSERADGDNASASRPAQQDV